MEGTEEKGHIGEARERYLVTVLEKDLPPAFFFLSEHAYGLRAAREFTRNVPQSV